MNPLLWLNAVVDPLFLFGAWLFRNKDWLAALLILGGFQGEATMPISSGIPAAERPSQETDDA